MSLQAPEDWLLPAVLALLLILSLLAWWRASTGWRRARTDLAAAETRIEQAEGGREQAQDLVGRQRAQLAALQARLEIIGRLERDVGQARQALQSAEQRHAQAEHERGLLEARLTGAQQQLTEQQDWLRSARSELRDSFQALAGELLEDRSRRFSEQNQAQIGGLLAPVREQLQQFEQALRQGQGEDKLQRSLLLKELDALRGLNTQLSEEAHRLTHALRGQSQVQGAWGEMVLERLLEAAGLTEGREYERQRVLRDDAGGRPRPDVLVLLPADRALVVDAKVSLTAYERYVTAVDEDERKAAMDQHLASVRRHLQDLSSRNYDHWLAQRTLDLVLLFVPIEGAFADALRNAPGLSEEALGKRVVLVSPATLLATLKTVHHVWRQEQRNRHAEEIARRAARLYDKLVGFVTDLEQAQSALQRAEVDLQRAFRKLSSGRGNLLAQAESLRDLGVEPSKQLPAVDPADEVVDPPQSSPG
ncbi:MAG: DNA recombination protein RmuC [Xanthomonadales bacterium]|nr:DNA recombination protein RmuC [Xanthomonadales bacterium]